MNPTRSCTKANLEKWMKPTLERAGLRDYTLTISGSSEKGDGYLGEVTFVNACDACAPSQKRVLSYVVKCGKNSKDLRALLPVRNAFENEIYFYRKVMPEFTQFQREKNVKEPFGNVPQCFDTVMFDEMEVLILDDMKMKDFRLHERREPMNREHIDLVMETYAKLHAISFAMKDQKPEVFDSLARGLQDVLTMMTDKGRTLGDFNVFDKIIEIAKRENDEEVVQKCNDLYERFKEGAKFIDPDDPCAIILHGDCWNNNFMFEYSQDQTTTPNSVCLLDFQLSRLASPVCDLAYFLFTCLSEEDLDDFDAINMLYYKSLSSAIRELGSDPDVLFPFDELQRQWEKVAGFGLTLMPSIINLCLSDEDEVPDLVESSEAGANLQETFIKPIRKMDEYRARTVPLIKLAIKKGFM